MSLLEPPARRRAVAHDAGSDEPAPAVGKRTRTGGLRGPDPDEHLALALTAGHAQATRLAAAIAARDFEAAFIAAMASRRSLELARASAPAVRDGAARLAALELTLAPLLARAPEEDLRAYEERFRGGSVLDALGWTSSDVGARSCPAWDAARRRWEGRGNGSPVGASLGELEDDLGAGAPLDAATAARMSSRLGADVGHARIHEGAGARAKADAVGAAAFTVGPHVVMGAPATDELLAHELAHTLQQKDADRSRPIAHEDAGAESNADAVTERGAAATRSGVQLQRMPFGKAREAATAGAARPGAAPLAATVPGEIRIDADGDRREELVLRFSTTETETRMVVSRVNGEPSEARELRWKLRPSTGFGRFAQVLQVTDGHSPTIVECGDDRIRISPARIAAGRATYAIETPDQKATLEFAAASLAPLVVQSGARRKDADRTSYDLELGEYRDRFRFQLEANPSRATFTIRPLSGQHPIGAADVSLNTWAQSLTLVAGDPRSIRFNLGRGNDDLVLYDRLEGKRDPAAERTHTLTLVGPGVAKETSVRFAAESTLRPRDDVDSVLALQGDQGGFDTLLANVHAHLTLARKQALGRGLISRATYDAWERLAILFAQLDGQRKSSLVDPKKRVDPGLKTHTAVAALTLQGHLHDDTAKAPKAYDRGLLKNKWTGMGGHAQYGHGFDLHKAILDEKWGKVYERYRALVDGLDRWIEDTLRPHSREEGLQQASARELAGALEDIAPHSPVRVRATYTPKEAPDKHIPLNLFVYRDEKSWHLRDVTNPKNIFDDTIARTEDRVPPHELFEKLDWNKHFPAGEIRYRIPGGRDGTVACNGKKLWYEWFTEVAAWLGVAALFMTGAGMGAAAAVSLVGAAASGAIGAVGDLADHASHNKLSATVVVLDLAQVVAGVATSGQVITGRMLRAASAAASSSGSAAAWSRLATLGDTYLAFSVASAASNTLTLAVTTAETIEVLRAVITDPNLTPSQRRDTLLRIVSQLALAGSLTLMSIHGDLAPVVREGGAIQIANQGGIPVAVPGGQKVPRPSSNEPAPRMTKLAVGSERRHVDRHGAWLTELNTKLSPEEARWLRLLTYGKPPAEIHAMFDGDLEIAVAKARRSNLPNDLIKLRNTLSDDARKAFDAKWEDIVRGDANPDTSRINSFRKFLAAMKARSAGDLSSGLQKHAQPALDRITRAPEIAPYPREWNEKFKQESNATFARRLEEFRGTIDRSPQGAGGEGAVFVGGDETRALKRWFKSRLKDFQSAIDRLRAYRDTINNNPQISKHVEVVRIYEVGDDWILRDWIKDSVEIRSAPESELSRKASIDALQASTNAIERDLAKKLNERSANVHWSPSRAKMIVIDTQ
ncbi:MAG: DUF4157 domain-containing protein [Deltaproteobacteria bacterium]|nr:DUF4157 domain-containing protein [Deltaproteobacteria bacterium]